MGSNNAILAGDENSITASNRCTIINGQNNVISSKTNTHIIGDNITASLSNAFYVGCSNGLFCDGDVVAYSSSDERLKDNIKPISNCLDKVLSLDAIEFDWNDKQQTYQGRDIGLIAQQVQEVAPEIVTKREDGYLAVKYEKVIPLLIGATQEQDAQLKELERQIKELAVD
jgi:hypothetical protein